MAAGVVSEGTRGDARISTRVSGEPRLLEESPRSIFAPPPPTLYSGILFRLNTRGHRFAVLSLAIAAAAWLLTLTGLGSWTDHGYGIASSDPNLGAALIAYVAAFLLTANLWFLRTGFRGRSARVWMAAFWVQFLDHLTYASGAGLEIIERGLPASTATHTPAYNTVARALPDPLTHALASSLVLVLIMYARHRHARPSPDEAVQHNCGCAAHSQSRLQKT